MAINSSNSNLISILDLPQTQELVDGDLVVVQTENGFQAIDFANFNAVKTDAAGNATVKGNLSGTKSYFSNIVATESVASLNYSSNNVKGTFAPNGYYNNFTINGGLVTSAAYVLGSPEYTDITTRVLPNLTSYQNTIYKVVIDESSFDPGQGPVTIIAGTVSQTYYLAGFYGRYPGVSPGSIQPQHFYLTPTATVSACPFISSVLTENGGVTFTVSVGYPVLNNLPIYWRLLYTYVPTS